MKKLKYVFTAGLGVLLMTGCGSSASEDFEEINGGFKKKRIKEIVLKEKVASQEEVFVGFSYDSDKKLSKIITQFDNQNSIVNYNNTNGVIQVSQQQFVESFNTEELFKAPYKVYETGEVLEYDSNKNPSKILFRNGRYDSVTESYVIENFIAEMFYDTKPNLYYGTFESAGLIDVLDGVKLDFGVTAQASEIVKARALFPVNNLIKVVYKNADEEVVGSLEINYTYDADGYPVKGVGEAKGDGEIVSAIIEYSYQ